LYPWAHPHFHLRLRLAYVIQQHSGWAVDPDLQRCAFRRVHGRVDVQLSRTRGDLVRVNCSRLQLSGRVRHVRPTIRASVEPRTYAVEPDGVVPGTLPGTFGDLQEVGATCEIERNSPRARALTIDWSNGIVGAEQLHVDRPDRSRDVGDVDGDGVTGSHRKFVLVRLTGCQRLGQGRSTREVDLRTGYIAKIPRDEKQQHDYARLERGPSAKAGTTRLPRQIAANAGCSDAKRLPSHSNAWRSIHPSLPSGKTT
jgi:hypothetical protein